MKLEFETKAAEQIYKRVMDNTAPEAKPKVEEMFDWFSRMKAEMGDGRVDGWHNNTVSEKEAQAVEAALKRHDVITRNAIGIGFYDAYEVRQTLNDPEVAWWKMMAEDFPYQNIKALNTYIQNYQKSSRLPEAYYWLAHFQIIKYDTREAILTNENIVKLFPNSVQASEALNDLIPLYHQTGEDQRAFTAAQRWLKKPEYRQRAFYYKPPSYETVRNDVMFFQGEYYQAQRLKEKAREIYSQIISGKEKKDAVVAQGAMDYLADFKKSTSEKVKYLQHKLNMLNERAKYLHYDRRNYKTAARIYREIFKLSAGIKELDYLYEMAESGLVEIKLRKIKTSVEAFRVVEELGKEGKIKSFLSYYTGYSEWNDFSGIPPKQYLLHYLLRSCKDVYDVRIAMATSIVKVDKETKGTKKIYWIIYKTEKGWRATDAERSIYWAENIDELTKNLEKRLQSKLSQISSRESLFAKSWKEFNKRHRLSPNTVALELEQVNLSKTAKQMIYQMLQSIKTKFNGEGEEARKKLVTFARAFSILPKSHFRGLAAVYFDRKIKDFCGEYLPWSKTINLACSDSTTSIHEISHHWDIGVMRGKDDGDQTDDDPSLIYYRISWDKWSRASCARPGSSCAWDKKPDAKSEDFARIYGQADGLEDKATSFESYVEGTDQLTRKQVREQIKQGNFKPAAKYVFNKYVESYDEEDGLCFEYNLKPDDPPLSLQEVKNALAQWLAKHPGSVHKDVLASIEESEEYYLSQRSKFRK